MSSWLALQQELDQWQADGKVATFWWRDDDLNEPTTALERLIALRDQLDIPLNLAVIPNLVDPHILDFLEGCHLLQHGVLHKNFAGDDEKKSEFPKSRDPEEATRDIIDGKSRLEELFSETFMPVFVPPWNRIADDMLQPLVEAGFSGVSRYKSRRNVFPVTGLFEMNTHIDPVFWRGHRSALEEEAILKMVLVHLMARRNGMADILEPTGILTHHLVHDEAIWQITFKLLDFLNRHEAVRWMTFPAAMALAE